MDMAFAKSIATGAKAGPALTSALAGALPNIGALQLGMVGLAFTMAEKLAPAFGQAASYLGKTSLEATGLTDEFELLVSSIDEVGQSLYKVSGIDLGLGRYKDQLEALKKISAKDADLIKAAAAVQDAIDKEAAAALTKKLAKEKADEAAAQARALAEAEKRVEISLQKEIAANIYARSIVDAHAKARDERRAAEKLANERNVNAQMAAERAVFEANELQRTIDDANKKRDAEIERLAAEQKAKAEADRIEQERRAFALTSIQVLNQATATWVNSVVSGQKSMSEATEDMAKGLITTVVQMSLMAIQAAAIRSAADAFASSTATAAMVAGPAGVAIAAGTAAAFFGAAMAYQDQLPQLATGGLVMGGIPGRDSVQAMLQPGEFVIPARETSLLRAMMGRNAGGGGTTIVINNTIPDSRATERMVRDQIIPAQRRLARLGGR
jgi:hypothetical protein